MMSEEQDDSREGMTSRNDDYTVKRWLKDTLKNLDSSGLKEFQWYLVNAEESKDGFKPIPLCYVERADRFDTVNLMMQRFSIKTREVAVTILKKMKSDKVSPVGATDAQNSSSTEEFWCSKNNDPQEVKIWLKHTLEDLDFTTLKEFHWYLNNADQSKDGFNRIPLCYLEKADRLDTVDLMMHKYSSKTREVAVMILKKIKGYEEKSLPELVFQDEAVSPVGATDAQNSIEEFWRIKQNDPQVYKVTKTSHMNRVALLITNIKFSDARMDRKGAEVDHKNMKRQLSILGYEVVTYTDLTGQGINEAFIKFAKHPKLSMTDSVVVVVMSHGKPGVVAGVNHSDTHCDEFPIKDIITHLGPENCPALLDKPKIIIIQACRGGEKGSLWVSDAMPQPVAEQGCDKDKMSLRHREKDFIYFHSCTPDTMSYRHPKLGSVLIQYLVVQCNTSANEDSVQELFRKVMLRFEGFEVQDDRQMPTIDRNTMTKLFYFYPGL